MSTDGTVEKLLFHYRFWGFAAVCFFIISISLLMFLVLVPGASLKILYIVLLCGFLWIGSTSFSRHALVILKRYMGREVGMLEFLSTQFVALLFPLAYKKVKNEVKAFKEKQAGGNGR
jgi:hypothetical protein